MSEKQIDHSASANSDPLTEQKDAAVERKPKRYDTGKHKWYYRQPADFRGGISYHNLLGPCPECGSPTEDYGGNWACNAYNCRRSAGYIVCNNGPMPDWWTTDINVTLDGNAWRAYRDGFINLQESDAGFGATPQEAVEELRTTAPDSRDQPQDAAKTK